MSDEANYSRVEDILGNIVGESHELKKPRSRVEDILTNILNGSSIFGKAQSRVEDLLVELADIIESGGSLTNVTGVTLTSNGSFSITPPSGYSGMISVSGTVSIPVYDGTVTNN